MPVEGQEGATDAQVNEALAGIGESPMDPGKAPEAENPAPAAPQWNAEEWAFDHNGKRVIPESRDKIMTWANQGYNYSQRMGQLNQTHAQRMAEAQAIETRAKQLEELYSPFAKVNEFAEKNPEWWKHVTEAFEKREQPAALDPAIAQVLAPIQEKLSVVDQLLADQAQAKAAAEEQAAEVVRTQQDQALDAEIESIRKQYPNIDLSARDESGETAERRVMLHAQKEGIGNFRAAFRDLFHDQLVVQQGAQTRLQAVKTTQTQTKAGILGTTQAPTKELKRVAKGTSWSDPSLSPEAILEELRQIGG